MLVKVAWQPFLAPLDAPDVRYLVGGSHDVWVILVNVGERMVPQGVLQVGGVGAVTHPLVGGVGAVVYPSPLPVHAHLVDPAKHGCSKIEVMDTADQPPHPRLVRNCKVAERGQAVT